MRAKVWSKRRWIDVYDTKEVKGLVDGLVTEVGLEVVGFKEHHFTPMGYTAVWLLAESHLAVHTYPEHKKSYIELSACHKGKFTGFWRLLGRRAKVRRS